MAVKEQIALLSTFVNLLLGISKIFIGLLTGSISVVADGLHSSLDVLSSFITYVGIIVSKKPVDKQHPYGYYKSETLAGLFISVIVFLSTVWILYEAVNGFISPSPIQMGNIALGIMIVSAITNFVMSRIKFKYGNQYDSIALIADASHSEIDVFTSVAVVLGLLLNPFFSLGDSLAAFVVGIILLKKSIDIGGETTGRLLDISAGEEIESKIKEVAVSVPRVSKVSDLKTRRIGSNIFAEISLNLDPRLKIEQADKISKNVEDKLISLIPQLKHITIQIRPLEFRSKSTFGGFNYTFRKSGRFKEIGPQKSGKRVIVPVLNSKKINEKFGSAKYLLVDVKGGKIVRKQIIDNPYFEKTYGHGTRFANSVKADKIIAKHIGPNARTNLESQGIEVEITKKSLKKIVEESVWK